MQCAEQKSDRWSSQASHAASQSRADEYFLVVLLFDCYSYYPKGSFAASQHATSHKIT
jgi:hypothetical protein